MVLLKSRRKEEKFFFDAVENDVASSFKLQSFSGDSSEKRILAKGILDSTVFC